MSKNPREDIKKIVEWHMTCLLKGPGQFPCNFVPLIVGPSGSGKTYTITQEVHNIINHVREMYTFDGPEPKVPFIYIDATKLTAEGWAGLTISESLVSGVDHIDDLAHAIIYVDEIDKLATYGHRGEGASHKINIQSNLLSWLDGTSDQKVTIQKKGAMSESIDVNMSQATWIFSGAFESLFEAKSLEDNGLGFNSDISKNGKVDYEAPISWNDIKKVGLMPELVNRMNVLIQTKAYTDRELADIVSGSYDMNFIDLILGVKVPPRKIVKTSKKHNAGARGLTKEMYQHALNGYKLKREDL